MPRTPITSPPPTRPVDWPDHIEAVQGKEYWKWWDTKENKQTYPSHIKRSIVRLIPRDEWFLASNEDEALAEILRQQFRGKRVAQKEMVRTIAALDGSSLRRPARLKLLGLWRAGLALRYGKVHGAGGRPYDQEWEVR